jgi:hypothetical protein
LEFAAQRNVKNCGGALRKEKVAALESEVKYQENVFRKQSNDDFPAL